MWKPMNTYAMLVMLHECTHRLNRDFKPNINKCLGCGGNDKNEKVFSLSR